MIPLINRKFNGKNDVTLAARLVNDSEGVKKTMEVAENHTRLAIKAVDDFPDSQGNKNAMMCRDALRYLAQSVLTRQK